VQSTSSYPSFSVYIHKEARKTAAGNDDGCAPDNMVITASITNDTFFSFPLSLSRFVSRFLLPISYTLKTRKKNENNSKRMAWEICLLALPKTSYAHIEELPSCVTNENQNMIKIRMRERETEGEKQKRINN
jgi:hypothetical protein